MNVLSVEKRAQILHLLVGGNSMRATSRIAGVSINTVTKLLIDAGSACLAFQDEVIRGIKSKRIQCDEVWSFCGSKEKNVPDELKGQKGGHDCYTWTAIDADTKLAISWFVGRRDVEYAEAFMSDLAWRLADRIQFASDGCGPCINDVEKMFDGVIGHATLAKIYGGEEKEEQMRYSRASFVHADMRRINGTSDPNKVSISHVERKNLTMRMSVRRLAFLTSGFSKKVKNLECAVALHFMYYNFGRIHKALSVTPAMEAGISDHVISMSEIAGLVA